MRHRTKEFKDYYKILAIPETAAEGEIKKAYRGLALENHPDHNPDDPQSESRFKEITEAYGVLIDPVKRREYDRFREDTLAGRATENHEFRYSQQDIFDSLFRQGAAREIFEELNREFSRSGFRSGNVFFKTMLFGGALGGLGRILTMLPGPLGKLGLGLRLAHMVGSTLVAANRMRKARGNSTPAGENIPPQKTPGVMGSIKGIFTQSLTAAPKRGPHDIEFTITLSPAEALSGTQKKISYKAGDETERLLVHIPPNFPNGGKLRIKQKGGRKNDIRGDLILRVKIETPNNV